MCEFSKMHGAGNDFIVADNKLKNWPDHADFIQKICDRKRGIGADGLILLSALSVSQAQVKMDFFNKDGFPAEMCGNGLRCAALFAKRHLGQANEITFETAAGLLKTKILDTETVEIEIPVIKTPEKVMAEGQEAYFSNTGVPHLVLFVNNIDNIDVNGQGCALRNHQQFQPAGTNVNFIEWSGSTEGQAIKIRTYERGVEAETAACGTGIAAAALTLASSKNEYWPLEFLTKDNDIIKVDKSRDAALPELGGKVLLTGPAVEVFQGKLPI